MCVCVCVCVCSKIFLVSVKVIWILYICSGKISVYVEAKKIYWMLFLNSCQTSFFSFSWFCDHSWGIIVLLSLVEDPKMVRQENDISFKLSINTTRWTNQILYDLTLCLLVKWFCNERYHLCYGTESFFVSWLFWKNLCVEAKKNWLDVLNSLCYDLFLFRV